MKKAAVFFLFFSLIAAFSPAAGFAQTEDETEYSYGTVKSVAAPQLVVSEYDFEQDADVDVTYVTDTSTEYENVKALAEIAVGDEIEIDYLVKDGKNMATLISVERLTEEDLAETAETGAAE